MKRSTDTRIRREVVGQMLDYASRMRAWSASELRASTALLDVPDDLWAALDSNLKAERMRLIFAADSIPDSLASMIDFLDRSMDSIEVCGVEIIPAAIEDAKENAKRNGLDNVEFFVGKAEEVLPEQYEKNHIKADVIVVDPPRKGCDELCLETIVKMAPEKVVYVSCDSSTLARDVKYLGENGYAVKRVRTVDMFGMSGHVETVALLTKKDITSC